MGEVGPVARAIEIAVEALFFVAWFGCAIYAGAARGIGAAIGISSVFLWFLVCGLAAGSLGKVWDDRNKPSTGQSRLFFHPPVGRRWFFFRWS
jgi:hypothetical protein